MNEICEIFENAKSNSTITLEKEKTYHIYQDDCFELTGYYCTNTARHNENPSGRRFTALYLKDMKDITIEGNGAKIIVHGKMTPLLFDNCSDITVNNLEIDYFCPTMSEFTVLENKNGVCKIKINEDCLFDVTKNSILWHGERNKKGKYYWKDFYNSNKHHNKILFPDTHLFDDLSRKDLVFSTVEKTNEENVLKVTLKNKEVSFPEGAVIQTRNIIRDHTGSLFQRCRNLHFEGLRVKFMHGLGMVCQFCENVTYKNCDFTPSENRTSASTADFFQFSGCKGRLLLQNIKASGAHDDFVNVHGTHLRIVRQNKRKNTITVRFMHHESWGFRAFCKGDRLEFIKWDTLIPYNEATVLDYKRLNDTDIRLYLDDLPNGITLNKDVVENATRTPDLTVTGCSFGLTCGRGILATTRGKVLIEGNSFKDVWGPALLIEDDCNFWFESGYTRDIVFKNNTVDRCDYRKMYPGSPVIRYSPKVMDENSKEYVHKSLTVEGNTFINPVEEIHLFDLSYLEKAVIKNNVFQGAYKINTSVVGDVIDENNRII